MEVVNYWETDLDVFAYWSTRTDIHLEDAVFHLSELIRIDRSWVEAGTIAQGEIRNAVTRIENAKVMSTSMFKSLCDPKPGTYCDEMTSGDPDAFVPHDLGDDSSEHIYVPSDFDPMAHGEIASRKSGTGTYSDEVHGQTVQFSIDDEDWD